MRTIQVSPEQLHLCATRMDQSNQVYDRCIQELYAAVDTMQSMWKGKDNLAFTAEIQAFESDLKQISVLCQQYQDFLKTSARSYTDMQDEITAQATRLLK